jgi:hypothetical protein
MNAAFMIVGEQMYLIGPSHLCMQMLSRSIRVGSVLQAVVTRDKAKRAEEEDGSHLCTRLSSRLSASFTPVGPPVC